MTENMKEIEELTWKAINEETKRIHYRDDHFRKLLEQSKIEHMGV